MTEGLTWGKLMAMYDSFSPKLFYVISEDVKRGQVIRCEETRYTPEFFVCHPDDFETIASEVKGHRRLVPLSEYIST